MSLTVVISLLTPVVVFFATELVNKIRTDIPNKILLGVVVPVISVVAAYFGSLVVPSGNILLNALYGLGAVFIDNLLTQFNKPPAVPPVSPTPHP